MNYNYFNHTVQLGLLNNFEVANVFQKVSRNEDVQRNKISWIDKKSKTKCIPNV
jgi:hypothetical protein